MKNYKKRQAQYMRAIVRKTKRMIEVGLWEARMIHNGRMLGKTAEEFLYELDMGNAEMWCDGVQLTSIKSNP